MRGRKEKNMIEKLLAYQDVDKKLKDIETELGKSEELIRRRPFLKA